jgi:serine/threonine protein kinase
MIVQSMAGLQLPDTSKELTPPIACNYGALASFGDLPWFRLQDLQLPKHTDLADVWALGPMGATAKVLFGRWGAHAVAVRLLQQAQFEPALGMTSEESWLHECQLLARCQHANVCPLLGIGCEPAEVLFEGYSELLFFVVTPQFRRTISNAATAKFLQKLVWARQVSHALAYMHSQGVVHRDVAQAIRDMCY